MPPPWTPLALVKTSADYLTGKGVPGARLDAEILLCRALGLRGRVELYAGFERAVAPAELDRYREWIRRRAAREPVSRILGEKEFMGLRFAVTPAVLSPRPESEILVEAALARLRPPKPRAAPSRGAVEPEEDGAADAAAGAWMDALLDAYAQGGGEDDDPDAPEVPTPPVAAAGPPRPPPPRWRGAAAAAAVPAAPARILDMGTGSGCLAVALAVRHPAARVAAVDISAEALAVARANARELGVGDRVEFRLGDWWDACAPDEAFDVIVSNPPYLTEGDPDIWPEARDYDPPKALYGGGDGLAFFRRLAEGWPGRLKAGGWLLAEVGFGQSERVADAWRASGLSDVEIINDHADIGRVVAGRRPGASQGADAK